MPEGTGPQSCDFRKASLKISGNLRHDFLVIQADSSGIIHLLLWSPIYINPKYQTSQFRGDVFCLPF